MKNIHKIILSGIILITLTILTIINNSKKEDYITVAEVTHSVFYAPWYVALKNDYFDDLKINVILTSGANNVTSAVLSGDAHIGLCGPEATIYAYQESDPIKSFASLTKKDGQFLVLKNDVKINDIKDLNGLNILAGRSGGMPLISFKNALKKNNINLNVDESVDFANLTSAFISKKEIDGVNLFEPNATNLVKQGYGYIAYSIGSLSGNVPYTAFNAKESFIKNNKDIILKFYKGIEKGLEFVRKNDAASIASVIKDEFPDTDIDDLTKMIKNYKDADSWYANSKIPEKDFNYLLQIIKDNNLLDKEITYQDVIYEVNRD